MFKEINNKYKEYSKKLEEFDRIDLDKVGFNKCIDEREFTKDRLEFYYYLRKAVSKGDKKKDEKRNDRKNNKYCKRI